MRLIDKDALKDNVLDLKELSPTPSWVKGAILTLIDTAPTVDAVPVKHGRWTTEDSFEWHCSECGYEPLAFENTPYCPNCGAKMDLGSEETDD